MAFVMQQNLWLLVYSNLPFKRVEWLISDVFETLPIVCAEFFVQKYIKLISVQFPT